MALFAHRSAGLAQPGARTPLINPHALGAPLPDRLKTQTADHERPVASSFIAATIIASDSVQRTVTAAAPWGALTLHKRGVASALYAGVHGWCEMVILEGA
jgi:hypothetical protein